jgi:hypothetical protein
MGWSLIVAQKLRELVSRYVGPKFVRTWTCTGVLSGRRLSPSPLERDLLSTMAEMRDFLARTQNPARGSEAKMSRVRLPPELLGLDAAASRSGLYQENLIARIRLRRSAPSVKVTVGRSLVRCVRARIGGSLSFVRGPASVKSWRSAGHFAHAGGRSRACRQKDSSHWRRRLQRRKPIPDDAEVTSGGSLLHGRHQIRR